MRMMNEIDFSARRAFIIRLVIRSQGESRIAESLPQNLLPSAERDRWEPPGLASRNLAAGETRLMYNPAYREGSVARRPQRRRSTSSTVL